MTDWKFIEMREPFVYVSARPYFAEVPKDPRLPEAMTQVKGDRIKELTGKEFKLDFYFTQPVSFAPVPIDEKYHPVASGLVKLIRAERIPWCYDPKKLGKHDYELAVFDWVFQYLFDCDRKLTKILYDFKDSYCDSGHALRSATCHWGTQSWKGLTAELSYQGQKLFRDDVDIFDTEEITPSKLILAAHSHKPDLLREFRKEHCR